MGGSDFHPVIMAIHVFDVSPTTSGQSCIRGCTPIADNISDNFIFILSFIGYLIIDKHDGIQNVLLNTYINI